MADIPAGSSRISWSPDNKKIAYSSYPVCQIKILNLESKETNILINTSQEIYNEIDPVWTPDGNYIVFAKSNLSHCSPETRVVNIGPYDLYVVRSDGSGLTQLTTMGDVYAPSIWPLVILHPEWKYQITKTGAYLNLREVYSTSAKSLTKLNQGAIFTALEGPINVEGYNWWRIRTEDSIEGWIVDVPGWYVLETAP